MSILPKLTDRLSTNPTKISIKSLIDIGQIILKLTQKGKETIIIKIILRTNHKVGGLTLPDFKIFGMATIIRVMEG